MQYSAFVVGPDGKPAGWTTWSDRSETLPRCFVDPRRFRGEPGSLAIAGNSNLAEHGGWERVVPGIQPNGWYRFTAYYRAEGVPAENWQVVARLDWRGGDGGRVGQPHYVYQASHEGAWTRVTLDAPAPETAAAVVIQLYLSNAPQGTVWWDDISLRGIPTPEPRPVRIASVHLRPQGAPSAEENVRRFVHFIETSLDQQTDVILFPEAMTLVGTGKWYPDVAEPVPGPTTNMLGELARKRRSYVAAGILEREGPAVYNTAVLIGRDGNVAGKYRKVYIPRTEMEHGITPGSDYPVFETDFGVVGLMICWDVAFADPARALASRGAEVILMPIWGGDLTLAKARAIENRVYLVSSGYDHPSYVMDPKGQFLSTTRKEGTLAFATIDLNKPYTDRQLGDLRGRWIKELRLDIKPPQPGFRN